MTRPSDEVIALVDALVAQLDADTLEGPYVSPATTSYQVIVTAWQRFRALVDCLDSAVAEPFASGAAHTLTTAEGLAADEVDKLIFWLTHVGEAITHRAAVATS
jgi:hypothetical protein